MTDSDNAFNQHQPNNPNQTNHSTQTNNSTQTNYPNTPPILTTNSNNMGHKSIKTPNHNRRLIISLIILALIVFVVWGLIKDKTAIDTAPIVLQGQIQVQQTPIAAKVAGRIAHIHVKEGDDIHVGTPLIDMDSPEINAKIEEAQAAKAMAQSQLDKANNGARPEEIQMAYHQYQAAKVAAELAKTTHQRIDRLTNEGLMSEQKRDEARTNHIASDNKAQAAKAQYELAKMGAREEDRTAAKAQLKQVEGKLKEALIAKKEANLKSPIAGRVDKIIAKAGQVVGQGVPLVSVIDPTDQSLALNVTEDHLQHFAIGKSFTATIPALSVNGQTHEQTFIVYASSVLSDFATWRPTNSQDGYDMRTFEVLARPQYPNTQLRQGMSVLVEIPK